MNKHLQHMTNTLKQQFEADLNDWPVLVDLFHVQAQSEGEHWVRAGDVCGDFLFISEGLVRLYYVDHDGNDINEGFYDDGTILGPISSFMHGSPSQYNIQALEPCQFVTANYQNFHDYAADKPDILNFEIRFMQSLFVSHSKRDAKRMLSNGEQRYRWFCREYPQLLDRIPQYHIASFLGMTPVSLSRLRKKLGA